MAAPTIITRLASATRRVCALAAAGTLGEGKKSWVFCCRFRLARRASWGVMGRCP
jgi:hypothetical protein